MTNFVCGLRVSSLAIAFALSTSLALAQSGSTGGSIGNENKSLSGSRQDRSADPAPAAPRSKPAAEEPRSAPRQSKASGGGGAAGGGGGGGGNFDGAWSVTTVGCGGATTIPIVISSGQISGDGLSGRVSPNGASTSFGRWGELTSNGVGRFSGRSGSGTYRRNDGCSGSWSASKQ